LNFTAKFRQHSGKFARFIGQKALRINAKKDMTTAAAFATNPFAAQFCAA
jgi:hypothetical protein